MQPSTLTVKVHTNLLDLISKSISKDESCNLIIKAFLSTNDRITVRGLKQIISRKYDVNISTNKIARHIEHLPVSITQFSRLNHYRLDNAMICQILLNTDIYTGNL